MHQQSIDPQMLTTDLLLFPMEYAVRSSMTGMEAYDEVTSPGIPSGKTLKAIFNPLREYMRNQESVVSAKWSKKYQGNGTDLQVFQRLLLTHDCFPECEDTERIREFVNQKAEALLLSVLEHLARVASSSHPAHLFVSAKEEPFDSRPNEIPYQHKESAEIARNYILVGQKAAGMNFTVGARDFSFPRIRSVDTARHPFGRQEPMTFRVSSVKEMYERSVKADTDIRLRNKTGITVVFSEESIADFIFRGEISSEAELRGRRVHVLARKLWPSVFIQGDWHLSYHVDKLLRFED